MDKRKVLRQASDLVGESQGEMAVQRAVAFSETAEKKGCLLCGSAALEVTVTDLTDNRLGTPGSYEVRRCVHCGFEQTAPLPTLADLTQLYEKHYNFGGEKGTLYTKLRQ